MPFVNMPTAVLNMPAPDWGRFAAQANEFIMKGAEMRQRSGEKFLEQLDKSTAQMSKIMQYNSPEEKAKRQMEMMKTQAMTEIYKDFKLHPEKYQMTANGPVLRDPLAAAMKWTSYQNAIKSGTQMDINIQGKQQTDAAKAAEDALRARAAFQNKQVGSTNAGENVDHSKDATLVAAPDTDTASNQAPANTYAGTWHQADSAEGTPYWYNDEGEYRDTPPE